MPRKRGQTDVAELTESLADHVAQFVKGYIIGASEDTPIAAAWIAQRVSQLLVNTAGWGGETNQLSSLHGATSKRDKSVQQMEVGGYAHRGKPQQRAKGKTSGVGQRSYWAKMTPEERKAEMQRRRMVSAKSKAA